MEPKTAILHHLNTFNAIIDTMIGLQIDCRTGFRSNKSIIEESQAAEQKSDPSFSIE